MGKHVSGVEHWVHEFIPVALLAVVVILVIEFFYPAVAATYDAWINVVDTFVILVFATDLWFKYKRAKEWEGFLKQHWPGIIAILPFFLIFRMVEFITIPAPVRVGAGGVEELAEHRSGFLRYFRSAEFQGSVFFQRVVRPVSRSLRLEEAAEFFKHPADDTET